MYNTRAGTKMSFVDRGKYDLHRLLLAGRKIDAALFVIDPMCADTEIASDMIEYGGHRNFTPAERREIEAYCADIGFDFRAVLETEREAL